MQDLVYKNGDIVLAGDVLTVSGVELLLQRLNIKFKWFQDEYIYDTAYGIPYFQEILGQKKLDIYDVFNILISKIEEESDVKNAELEDFDFDTETRKMQIKFAISSIYGNLIFTQTI